MTKQKDNIVGGDQAGRDIDKSSTIYVSQLNKPTYMSTLIEKFKQEKKNNIVFNKTVEKLQHYCSDIDEGEIIGLDEKLNVANFEAYIEFAKTAKEQFSKKLAKYQHFESAQTIFVYLLAEIYSRFNTHVYILLKKDATQQEVSSAIQKHIVDPVKEMLEENILDILADEINGAIYFLTGNCHIKWV